MAELVNRRQSDHDEKDTFVQINQPARGPLISISQQSEFKYDSQATQPFFNNQNTILMIARSCSGDLMLMHETRVFYFQFTENRKTIDTVLSDDINYAQAADHMISVILGILTVRKYRLLQSFYLLWHILDYTMLASLIGLLFFAEEHYTLLQILWNYKLIFIVFGIEVFYDVLEYIVKIWILNRVSIFIGFILYILYALTFFYYKIWSQTVIILFFLRFIAFISSVTIDFCIDLEIEYDLYERTIHNLNVPFFCSSKEQERLALMHVSNHNEISLAKGWKFKGTKCVWTSENVFKCDVFNRYENGIGRLYYRAPFNVMFGITYMVVGIPLLIFITITVSLLSIKRRLCCCGRKGNTILDECMNRYSY